MKTPIRNTHTVRAGGRPCGTQRERFQAVAHLVARLVPFGLGSIVLLAVPSGTPCAGSLGSSAGPALINEVGIEPRLGERLPLDLEFRDSSGEPVQLADCFNGRPVILHLVYYDCPMLCKLSSDGLFSAISTLALEPGDDYSIVTLSFDPRETPELAARAREFAVARCGADFVRRGWRFLTGQQEAIATVTDGVGFRYAFDQASGQYAHAAGVFVLTPDGTVSRYLSGIQYSPRDLRLAVIEASGGRVGTATDQVLLLCYLYDPTAGKYGLAVIAMLRAAGLLTVGGMATAIIVMLRRERRRSADVRRRAHSAANVHEPTL